MERSMKDSFIGFSGDLRARVRKSLRGRISKSAFEERLSGIEKAIGALAEAGIDPAKSAVLLHKYWDLTADDAKDLIEQKARD